MDTNEGLKLLTEAFKNYAWFHDVGTDQYGRLVVYVKYMNHETLMKIPDRMEGRQVLVHFASSKLAKAEHFTSRQDDHEPFPLLNKEAEMVGQDGIVELPSSFLEFDLSGLCKELDRLEKICGSNCLQDIFYEIHDGRNAVTNNSARYPEVRNSLERLYQDYGFDVIYEELDG